MLFCIPTFTCGLEFRVWLTRSQRSVLMQSLCFVLQLLCVQTRLPLKGTSLNNRKLDEETENLSRECLCVSYLSFIYLILLLKVGFGYEEGIDCGIYESSTPKF
ncbi:hypothetical protein Hanom_Chr09g00853971 [Helianthus anomalus]